MSGLSQTAVAATSGAAVSGGTMRYPWGERPLGREDILDREQVGELLGLRPSTVDDLRRRGDLPAIRLGRHRRFLRADVEQFVVTNRP